jgi:hypothetical protein
MTDTFERACEEADEKEKKKKETQAQKLAKLAAERTYRSDDADGDDWQDVRPGGLFHTSDQVAYADVECLGRRETHRVRARGFRQWLIRGYYQAEGAPPSSEALQQALSLIEAQACIDGPQRDVFTRVGGARGKIYIDLANEAWQAIEIDAGGWQVLDSKQVPVRFRRAPGMLSLPVPITGGSVDWLREYLNVKSEEDFELALAWLLAAMRDRGPYPVLAVVGEQGAAKSSFTAILRSLVDPNTASLRSFPREDRDLLIAALNGWVIAFDNVSVIPAWLSDSLCRLSTGGGFATRKLYSDSEEEIFNAQRPAVLNGIEDFVNRPDLADRAIFLTLEQIPEERRRADRALQAELEQVRPVILGALLERMVVGLARLPQAELPRKPRMADFALWGTACERIPGSFMRAYEHNRASAVEVTLEHDLVASAVRLLMRSRSEWTGTAAELLAVLANFADENLRRGKDWPRTPRGLSGRLRRAAPNLRKIGIDVVFAREGHAGPRIIHITTLPRQPDKGGEQPSPSSPAPEDWKNRSTGNGLGGDGTVTVDGGLQPTVTHTDTANLLKTSGGDGADGGDGDLPPHSGASEPVCHHCGVSGNAAYGQLIRPDGGHYHPRCWTEKRRRRQVANDRREPNVRGPEVAGIRPNVLDVWNVSVVGDNGGGVHRCDHCGQQGAIGRYDWPHRPFGISLHSSCEGPWFDSEVISPR